MNLKKSLFLLVFSSIIYPFFAQSIPETLYGIWEGKDRYVFFEKSDSKNPEIVILLKEFYGWYTDRVAEPAEKSSDFPRNRNSATTKNPEHIYFRVERLSSTQNNEDKSNNFENENQNQNQNLNSNLDYDSSWEIHLQHSKFQESIVPVCVIDDKMYLDFYLKAFPEEQSEVENGDAKINANSNFFEKNGYWRGSGVSQGIKVYEQSAPEELKCYYIQDNLVFRIRYWKSDMLYSNEDAYFIWDNNIYYVNKHINSCGFNYSCTTGRRKVIRNLSEPEKINPDDLLFNSDYTVMILDKEPYLYKLADKNTFEQLIDIVVKNNSRRKPEQKPLFPEQELDWHWDLIEQLEKNNEIIQSVRNRQKQYGPRAKDVRTKDVQARDDY